MKVIIVILIIISTVSCKEDKKNEKPNTKKNQIVSHEKLETVLDYIDFGNKSRAKEVNDSLGELIFIDNISLFKEEISQKVFIVIKLKEQLEEGIQGNYRIVTRMYPYSVEELTENSIKNNIEFDSWYLEIMSRMVGNDIYLYGQVANEVDGFIKVKLQLLEKATKKYSNKQILIEHLEAR